MQELQEFGTHTPASDVYSFGVLLWEMYHSQPPYKKTQLGFYIQPHSFPKFEATAYLEYAALTVACLHSDPQLRCAH
jgi:serine/threonine protein kinase